MKHKIHNEYTIMYPNKKEIHIMIHTNDMLNDLIATSTSTPKHTAVTDADMLYAMLNDYIAKWGIDEAIHHLKVWLYLAEEVRNNKKGETI